MNPFEVLGVVPSADAATIKHAYAKLLRVHRPDEDPQGFQRLHEAYRWCLARAANQMAAARIAEAPATPPLGSASPIAAPPATTPGATASVFIGDSRNRPSQPSSNPEDATPVNPIARSELANDPMRRPSRPAAPGSNPTQLTSTDATPRFFVLDDFVDALCASDRKDPNDLQTWLEHCEPLYLFELKQAVTRPLLRSLAERREPLSGGGLQTVLRFFALDTISAERLALDPVIRQLERRAALAAAAHGWLPESAHVSRGARRNAKRPTAMSRPAWSQRVVHRELTEPFDFWGRAAILLVPMPRIRMGKFCALVEAHPDLAKDPMFQPGTIAFWSKALDRQHLSRWRVLMAFTTIALLCLLTTAAFHTLDALAGTLAIGGVIFLMYLMLVINDNAKARAQTRVRANQTAAGRVQTRRSTNWRWVIPAVLALNAIIGALLHN